MALEITDAGVVIATLAAEAVATMGGWPDKTVQAVGGTVTLEGSNDGAAWVVLTQLTADGVETIVLADGELAVVRENTLYVRNAAGATGDAVIIGAR